MCKRAAKEVDDARVGATWEQWEGERKKIAIKSTLNVLSLFSGIIRDLNASNEVQRRRNREGRGGEWGRRFNKRRE